MDEVEPGEPIPGAPPVRAGDLLRQAREAQGLSIAEVGQRTRIPLRHLEAIEAGDYVGLPSPTYAVGFARAYARAVGADAVAIGAMVRAEVDLLGRRIPEYEPYQMADPARVPSRGVAIVGLGLALAVLILVGLWYGTDLFRQGASAPASVASAPAVVAPVPAARPSPIAPTGGQVVLTARDEVWMRVYDADNKTLYLGTMKQGESYTVPADAKDPMINVGRADKLTVTLNGSAVAPLGTGEHAIKDVKVSGAAIAARAAGAAQPTSGASPTPTATSSPTHDAGRTKTAKRSAPAKPKLSETQRANLDAAASPPPPGNASTP
ncbi:MULTISPECIES: helix-turn-helix domain-containing protein [unclassified Sphingomonas]|uniref:helix-turn-helix domain-containing protein n=1 Tax=unclassified Sphingomonas TaxID=196159 RepID=UPI001F5A5D0C|nr:MULTISPECIES: helix-turn-helix domain-containing protein [unclassified Sphingomonas]